MDQIYHSGEIDHLYNYDQLFVRTVSVALGRTLNKSIRWINRFEDKKIRVLCPFYYSYIQENFVVDTYVDDVIGNRIQLDTTQRPRGIIKLKSWSPDSSKVANPNQYLTQRANINDEIRNIVSKVRAIPVTISYDIEIFLATQGDAEKAYQKVLDSLFNWKFFRYEYFGLNIDSVFQLPDSTTINIGPETVDFDQSDRFPKITFSLEVKTYYPLFKVDINDLEVCDNDDDIDWEYLGVPKPNSDFLEMVASYHNKDGVNKGINWNEAFVSRVFWKNYLYLTRKLENGDIEKIPVGKNNLQDDINKKQRPTQ